jgi:hypothetical protein
MLGATKWGSGPSVAFIHEDAGPWVFALVANNIWTFGGATGNNATNKMLLNPIISYHFADGWAYGVQGGSVDRMTCTPLANASKASHSGSRGAAADCAQEVCRRSRLGSLQC